MQVLQVFLVQLFSHRDHLAIPGLPPTRLITAHEQNCRPSRIEG
ncbi:MAG: hypothetical protein QOF33_468, partial [Thermomicrobiales bacterium]|nr:hypothetical protein [Thermomicrobiales bacterium]